jgi:hypothetical protein
MILKKIFIFGSSDFRIKKIGKIIVEILRYIHFDSNNFLEINKCNFHQNENFLKDKNAFSNNSESRNKLFWFFKYFDVIF